MKHLLILISSILLFTACAKDDAQEPTGPAQRSLLVFVSAENDLTNFADLDINEMIEGYRQVAGGNDLLVFVDKASYTEMPFIIRINKRSDHPVDTFTFASKQPKVYEQVILSFCSAGSTDIVCRILQHPGGVFRFLA